MYKNVWMLFVLMGSYLFGGITGIESLKGVFEKEIKFFSYVQKKIDEKNNPAGLTDIPLVQFIRENNEKIKAEIPVLMDAYEAIVNSDAFKKSFFNVVDGALALYHDPLLAKASSGKEIVILESYKKFKELYTNLAKVRVSLLSAYAHKMPLLFSMEVAINTYLLELVNNRIESALNGLQWEAPLKTLIQASKDSDWQVNNWLTELDTLINDAPTHIKKSFVFDKDYYQATKNFLIAICSCLGNDSVMQIIASLRNSNASLELFEQLLAQPDVQELINCNNEMKKFGLSFGALPQVSHLEEGDDVVFSGHYDTEEDALAAQ